MFYNPLLVLLIYQLLHFHTEGSGAIFDQGKLYVRRHSSITE